MEKITGKPAKITLSGSSLNQDQKVELFAYGTVRAEGRNLIMEYSETDEENIALRTVIWVSNQDMVTVNKFNGDDVITMLFQKGAISQSALNTPYGRVETAIHTEDVSVQICNMETGSTAVEVTLKYSMRLENGDLLNDSELKIECVY